MNEIEFEINFSDITMNQGGGYFELVQEIMNDDFVHAWMIRTTCTIDGQLGLSTMILHFHHDKNVTIDEYIPSGGNVFYNPDVQVLTSWCSEYGWLTPKPSQELIERDVEFWKHYWSTHLVDSDILDNIYGSREEMLTDEDINE